MAPLKLFLACSVLASAELCVENCEVQGDQTALLQSHLSRKGELSAHHTAMLHFPSLGNLKDPKKRRSSLAQFEQTATQLVQDRAAVTPGLQLLAESIVGMLQGNLTSWVGEHLARQGDDPSTDPSCVDGACGALGAIIEEHDNDENQIETEYNMFDAYYSRWADLQASMAVYNSTDASQVGSKANLVTNHETCRGDENDMCSALGECLVYESILQQEVDDREEELVEIDEDINTKWCEIHRCDEETTQLDELGNEIPCNNHLESIFRQQSKVLFIGYNTKLGQLNVALASLAIQSAYCVANGTVFNTKRDACTGYQNTFQSATCQHEQIVEHDIEDLRASWIQANNRYENTKLTVLINQGDRVTEWTTIRKVVCLLNELSNPIEITDPTATSSSYNTDAIEACHSLVVDTRHLEIGSQDPVPLGLPLASVLTDTCSADFVLEYYGGFGQCLDNDGAAFSLDYIPASKIGAADSCVCEHNTIVHFDNGATFPDSLVSYMLLKSALLADPDQPSEADKFHWAPANTWSMTVEGAQHSGVCSSQTPISASSKAALGLAEGATHYAWCYPEIAVDAATSLSPAMQLVRMGSFVYTTGTSATSALEIRTLEPWHFDEHSVTFDHPVIHWQAPVSISQYDFTGVLCNGKTSKVSSGRLIEGGAGFYCWAENAVVPGCENGCFAFEFGGGEEYSVYGAVR